VTARPAPWRVRLAAAAEVDIAQILAWTLERVGTRQARTYAATLSAALRALADGPDVPGARVPGENDND